MIDNSVLSPPRAGWGPGRMIWAVNGKFAEREMEVLKRHFGWHGLLFELNVQARLGPIFGPNLVKAIVGPQVAADR